MSQDSNQDLQHYLKVALLTVQSRLRKKEFPQKFDASIERLKILEELLKEQIPNENTDHPAR